MSSTTWFKKLFNFWISKSFNYLSFYGILVHSGTALLGHYVSELNLGINKNTQEWYLFNDESVYKIPIPSTEKTPSNNEYDVTPYILIYIRQDCIKSLFIDIK
jgi:ubiquitin C-terminal hydrolase